VQDNTLQWDDTRVNSIKSDSDELKKVVSFFQEKIKGVTPQNWQTVMTKKVVSFSRKNSGDTLSCRPG